MPQHCIVSAISRSFVHLINDLTYENVHCGYFDLDQDIAQAEAYIEQVHGIWIEGYKPPVCIHEHVKYG